MANPVAIDFIRLSKLPVLDPHGAEVALASFWKNSPAILVFVRHFGCPACRAHAFDVWTHREKYQKTGAKIYFIGNGQSAMIDQFKIDLKIKDAPIYVDPTLESFRAMGFKKVKDPYAGDGMKFINKAMQRGFTEGDYGNAAGDGTQLGGIVAIKPGNQITFHYISQLPGDYPLEYDVTE